MSARLVGLISGRGSNLAAIADACADGRLTAHIVRVISDRVAAAGLERARERGLETVVVDRTGYRSRDAFDRALGDAIAEARPDRIVLAGFMRILGPGLVARFEGRMLNIHPSLLPKYPGLDTHARALEAGDTEAGASVHVVTAELDAGPVIAQARVPILAGDDAARLAARVLEREHALYVEALQQSLEGTAYARSPRAAADAHSGAALAGSVRITTD